MLEAVALITTTFEIETGRFQLFMKQFEDMDPCELDFLVFTNTFTYKTQTLAFRQEIYHYTKSFKNVQIICLNINPDDDIYMKREEFYKTKRILPKLGLCSGPNISFFSAMDFCKKYDTTFLIETDCIIRKDAFYSFKNYSHCIGDFLIAGSKYDGKHYSGNIQDIKHTHLNGVALYKTGSVEFQTLMIDVENWIVKTTQINMSLPYDIAITMFVLDQIANGNTNYYRTVLRRMLPTTMILNYSIDRFHETNMDDIMKYYPNHKVLHIKGG
jgi:hypothetical protein